MLESVLRLYCYYFHTRTFRPVRNEYRCAECLRTWPVLWNVEAR